MTTGAQLFHSSNQHKLPTYQILGDKPRKERPNRSQNIGDGQTIDVSSLYNQYSISLNPK